MVSRGAWLHPPEPEPRDQAPMQGPAQTGVGTQHCMAGGRAGGGDHTQETDPVCAYKLSRFSRVQLFVTSWIVAHQAPLSTEILQTRILSDGRYSSYSGQGPS